MTKKLGYEITIYYIIVNDPNLAVERIAERVSPHYSSDFVTRVVSV